MSLQEKVPNIWPTKQKLEQEKKQEQEARNIVNVSVEATKTKSNNIIEKLKGLLKNASSETIEKVRKIAKPALAMGIALTTMQSSQGQDLKFHKNSDGTIEVYKETVKEKNRGKTHIVKTFTKDIGVAVEDSKPKDLDANKKDSSLISPENKASKYYYTTPGGGRQGGFNSQQEAEQAMHSRHINGQVGIEGGSVTPATPGVKYYYTTPGGGRQGGFNSQQEAEQAMHSRHINGQVGIEGSYENQTTSNNNPPIKRKPNHQ